MICKHFYALTVIVLATVAQSAIAQLIVRESQDLGQREIHIAAQEDRQVQPAVLRAYDNWRFPGWGGQTSTRGATRIGGQEVGDDLILTDATDGVVNDIGYSIANVAAVGGGSLSGVGIHFRFYDGVTNELMYTDSAYYTFVGFVIRPGEVGRGFFEGGFFRSFGIQTRAQMYLTMQFYDPAGLGIEDLGLGYGGPINTGSSSSLFRNFTTGQNIDLGADPQNNLLFFIDSVVVPAPTVCSVIATSSLFALRRRR